MVRLASLMRSAIKRRRPITLISDVSAETWDSAGLGCAGRDVAAVPAAARSSRRMRPPGPDPVTVARSMPASRARRRLAGDAMTLPWRAGAASVAALTKTGAAAVCGMAGAAAWGGGAGPAAAPAAGAGGGEAGEL